MEKNFSLWDVLINAAPGLKPLNTVLNFQRNFKDMKKTDFKGGDKYFHAKANCETGQTGDFGTAMLLDMGKEDYDMFRKNVYPRNGESFWNNLVDSTQDLGADLYGYIQGATHPFTDCRELLIKYRPNGLYSQY